ncbi:hypothetical protein APUTEX25_004068 [Auxenochlorella protothecoides]|uniref:Protein YIP n=1 Tax=Auxenochlorella protothecoides TaxID=3075 RepID=A0A3M7L562_AUXPR|nr:hypothetical protein APUTEX25_004068 [Auxenochlorella protothecoides]|eukprot:RMZ57234.1 hypothetical protein APUTEX25_004068 [Auxenochlorella protothecoides]
MDNSQNPFQAPSNPFGDPFGHEANVQTYQPPSIRSGAWNSADEVAGLGEDDTYGEPFSAAHLAAAHEAAVPAIVTPPPATQPQPEKPSVPLAFTGEPGRARGPMLQGPPAYGVSLLPAGVPPSLPLPGRGGPADLEDPTKYPFYNVRRYRTYFNVDTSDVLGRIFRAIALFFKSDFHEFISPNPDLYGPFWVATTLVFVSAVTGNYASYLAWKRSHAGDEASTGWYGDINKGGGGGLALYAALRYFRAGVSLAHVWCTYGYALAVFIPMAFVCVFPVEIMRWVVVGVATLTSGIFILSSFRVAVVEAAGAKSVPLFLVMAALHAGLGLALKLYFFRYASV